MKVERVINEGAELYCEQRGTGPLLLLIPGGLGDAHVYSAAADILADEFTVVTYDRRCYSRSTGDRTAAVTVAQQARDAAAIIEAPGQGPALVFGNSGGGIIALELATTRPELIDFLVVHEAPVIELLPDVEQWRAFVDDISAKVEREGARAAMMAFARSLTREPGTAPAQASFRPLDDNIEWCRLRYQSNSQRPCGTSSNEEKPDLRRFESRGSRALTSIGGEKTGKERGMMTALTVVLPLLPGKQEAWRQFCQTLQGSRRPDYDAWRSRMGITREEVWLSQTSRGDLVRIHLQAEHPEHLWAGMLASRRPFDHWLRQQVLELHGLDLGQLAQAAAHELIFAWQPASF
jgi:pimeloyl-ACP methyl ester carboxylesterase